MAPTRVILMSCGSYNPPTHMHLRMFETARDHLHRMGTHVVVGGVISPTHDHYGKKELSSAHHRCAMLKLATQDSDWIRVSTWEARQNGWTKTRLSLQHHQNLLNSVLVDSNDIKQCVELDDLDWIPENVRNSADCSPIQIKFLCGADLLESFGTPGLWAEEDIDAIVGQHGLVVITRGDANPNKFIYDSDVLSKYMHNIHIVTEWMRNEVSSTKIRRALRRGESVRYHVQDSVIEYIYKHGLYDAKTVSTIKLELSPSNGNDYLNIRPKYQSAFLTPSPSDITMTTPSPVEIISIDISESVFKKNFQNSPSYSSTRPTGIDETERLRDKFISVITENGNKQLLPNKAAYPGQAKQIIATETGKTQIFCEVGLNCISEKYKNESQVDGKIEHIGEDSSVDYTGKIDPSVDRAHDTESIADESCITVAEVLQFVRSLDPTPDESDDKVSVILSIDVVSSNEPCPENLEASSIHTSDKRIINTVEIVEEGDANPDENSTNPHNLKTANSQTDDDSNVNFETNAKKNDANKVVEVVLPVKDFNVTNKESRTESSTEPNPSEDLAKALPQIESVLAGNIVPPTTIEGSPSSDEKLNSLLTKVDSSKYESTTEEQLSKQDSVIEIDGKYIKSLLNSRKSPKKFINNEEQKAVNASDSLEESSESKSEAELEKSSNNTRPSPTELMDGEDAVAADVPKMRSDTKSAERRRGVVFQGSLDSINVTQPKSSTAISSHQPMSKKSKSYEFIKPARLQPATIYKISLTDLKDNAASTCEDSSKLKSDSTSVFTTANETLEAPTDEFCSVCCYANDPSSTEAFFTLRSTGSSPIEEDTTECDICSNCDTLEDGETPDLKTVVPAASSDPICEVCELCGDVATDEDVVASSLPEKDDFIDRRTIASRPLPLSLPKKTPAAARTIDNIDDPDDDDDDDDGEEDDFQIGDCGVLKRSSDKVKVLRSKSIDEHSTDNTNSNEDEFEIENCGLDLDLESDNVTESRYQSEVEDTFRNIVPRDEIAMSAKNSKKITRAGSLINRDTVDRTKTQRRYSSVDNLPNSRQVIKTPEKQHSLRPRGLVKGLVASADNIRPVRSSRSRSLRKSADDVGRGYHSSIDDTRESPLYENIQRKKSDEKGQQKPRDSATIKMILTKHGIKIISDKETAL